jgi:hypothetical protein
MYQCRAPVTLILFNRSDTLRLVINALRLVQPKVIFAIADGPREGNIDDIESCIKAREVLNEIDWDCNISKRFLDCNLGVGRNPAEGIDWVFDRIGETIILEDDCIPNPDFFKFCDKLLDRYRNNPRVMMISGNNHTLGQYTIDNSYAFTYHTQTHGWATWKDSWQHYDYRVQKWPKFRSYQWLYNITGSIISSIFWMKIFDKAYAKESPYWDFQWTLCCWINSGVNIVPAVNLVSNAGYGAHATNTKDKSNPFSNLKTESMSFPLVHAETININYKLGRTLNKTVYGFTFVSTAKRLVVRILSLYGNKK